MEESETLMIKMGIERVIEGQQGEMRKRLGNVDVLSCELGHECIGIVDSYYDFIDRHVITVYLRRTGSYVSFLATWA